MLAPRDSPPLATQGANDDASGTAALFELATVFSGGTHDHPSSSSRATATRPAHSARATFLARHRDLPSSPSWRCDSVAGRDVPALTLNGWTAQPPPRAAVALGARPGAGRAGGRAPTPLPPVTTQILRLAVPSGGGSQAPFVAAGIAAIELSAPGPARPAVADTLDAVSSDTLARSGEPPSCWSTAWTQRRCHSPAAATRSSSPVSASSRAASSSGSWSSSACRLAVRVDRARDARRAPPSAADACVAAPRAACGTLAAHAGSRLPRQPARRLLPGRFGAPVSPDALVSHAPHYLRVRHDPALPGPHLPLRDGDRTASRAAFPGRHRGGRRGRPPRAPRRRPRHARDRSLLARPHPARSAALADRAPGSWPRSALPVWAGLAVVGVSLAYLGVQLHLGWNVWWYFFLLLETRTIPVWPWSSRSSSWPRPPCSVTSSTARPRRERPTSPRARRGSARRRRLAPAGAPGDRGAAALGRDPETRRAGRRSAARPSAALGSGLILVRRRY